MYYFCIDACKVCNCCNKVQIAGHIAVKFTQNYCNQTLIQTGTVGDLSTTAIVLIAAIGGFWVVAAITMCLICCFMFYKCPRTKKGAKYEV